MRWGLPPGLSRQFPRETHAWDTNMQTRWRITRQEAWILATGVSLAGVHSDSLADHGETFNIDPMTLAVLPYQPSSANWQPDLSQMLTRPRNPSGLPPDGVSSLYDLISTGTMVQRRTLPVTASVRHSAYARADLKKKR